MDGLLVEFDNYDDIANKVIKLLKKKRLGKKMGNQGRERVMRNYTWDIIVEKTHEAIVNSHLPLIAPLFRT